MARAADALTVAPRSTLRRMAKRMRPPVLSHKNFGRFYFTRSLSPPPEDEEGRD